MNELTFTNPKNFHNHMLIDAEDGDLQQGHDEKLDRAGFPQNRSKRDQNRCCTEVSIYHSVEKELWDRCRVLLIGIQYVVRYLFHFIVYIDYAKQ